MRRFVLFGLAWLAAAAASAQPTYRWIDKDGLSVFSDQAPPPGARQIVRMNANTRGDEPPLSYATRQAVEKFPVTLYSAPYCVDACKQARSLLNGRGIPFAEVVLTSHDELAELARKLGSEAGVPSLFVGQQHLIGLETGAWNTLLDLAGYPKSAPYGAKPSGALAQ
jgi:glutaredoxin